MLVRDYVYESLAQRARDWLLRTKEDWYYGWVSRADGTGHWLGDTAQQAARQQLHDAEEQLADACCQAIGLTEHDGQPYLDALATIATAEATLHRARIRYDRVQHQITTAVEKRRQLRVDRLVSSLFLKLHRQAQQSNWPLWGPGVPPSLRKFILRWKDHPKLAPQQRVFLWLILDDTRTHADEFGVTAIGYQDWLAHLELVTSAMDTNARESEPSKATTDFLRQLQHREPEPAHENLDPRDTRADLVYDGPAREDADDRCPTCQGFLKARTIQLRGKYAQAVACDRWASTCRYELLTDLFPTRDALQDHLAVAALLELV
jgi:hypothetical protein